MLTTLHRFNPMLGIRTRAYWSSKGSGAEDSGEWLLLRLAHPACLVRSVAVRPFRATFQRVRPALSAQPAPARLQELCRVLGARKARTGSGAVWRMDDAEGMGRQC